MVSGFTWTHGHMDGQTIISRTFPVKARYPIRKSLIKV